MIPSHFANRPLEHQSRAPYQKERYNPGSWTNPVEYQRNLEWFSVSWAIFEADWRILQR